VRKERFAAEKDDCGDWLAAEKTEKNDIVFWVDGPTAGYAEAVVSRADALRLRDWLNTMLEKDNG